MFSPSSTVAESPSPPSCREEASAQPLSFAEIQRWARTGVLAAFALVLSYIETFLPLPIPLPGAKLGLANAAVLLALELVGWRGALGVACIKMLVTGLLFGSPLMLPYSALGTLCSFCLMAALKAIPGLSLILISMVGALGHIAGQLLVAAWMLNTALVWYSFPPLALVAVITGGLTGWIVCFLLKEIADASPTSASADSSIAPPLESASPNTSGWTFSSPDTSPKNRRIQFLRRIPLGWLLAALTLYSVAVFCIHSFVGLGIALMVVVGAAGAAGISLKTAAKALLPLASILVITAMAQILYAQQGTVLFSVGPIAITEGAIEATLRMMMRLLCLILASTILGATLRQASLESAFQNLTTKLRRWGVSAEGPLLSCELAFSFVPVLMTQFQQLRDQRQATNATFATGNWLSRLGDYRALLIPLAQSALHQADERAHRTFDSLAAQPIKH